MGYYDNPDRIMIGVDITTLTDIFEENYRDDTGMDFDWKKDGDRFNEASRELDVLIENVFVKMFGQAVAESYDDDTYVLTFWGDRNNPNDIKTLQELQGRADDTWRDNDRVQLAIYDTEFYTGNQTGKFADKWSDIGKALVDAITVGVDFPEEFDFDPMYDRVDGMNIKNSRRPVKSSRKPIKSANYNGFNLEARRSYGKGNGYFTTYPVWDTDLDTSIGAIEYHYAVENPYYVAWVYDDFGANKTGRTKAFDTEEECLEWIGEELASGTTARDKLLKYWEELGYDYKSKNLNNSRKPVKSDWKREAEFMNDRIRDDNLLYQVFKIEDEHFGGNFENPDNWDGTHIVYTIENGEITNTEIVDSFEDVIDDGNKYYLSANRDTGYRNTDYVLDRVALWQERNNRGITSSRKITSAKSGEVDSIAADELALCTVNDGDLYRQMATPIITNLKKKIKNGTYDKELALKAWLNLVTVEARKYVKEFGSRGDTIDKMFNLNTRKEAAKQVAEHYEDALNE